MGPDARLGDADGRVLVYDRYEWECFLDGVRAGEFDAAAELTRPDETAAGPRAGNGDHNVCESQLKYRYAKYLVPSRRQSRMSDDAYGATAAKRRLARRLTELRQASGHTANHVCDLLDWGRGKVGRFEANQWKRPEMSDIRDLMRVYGVSPARPRGARGAGGPGPGPAVVAGLLRRVRERVPRLRERRQPDPHVHAAGAARAAADPRVHGGRAARGVALAELRAPGQRGPAAAPGDPGPAATAPRRSSAP